MTKLIINEPSELAEYFENYPSRTYGRQTSYSVTAELGNPKEATGYSAVKRAAERINARGDNLRVDEVLADENWDLVNWGNC